MIAGDILRTESYNEVNSADYDAMITTFVSIPAAPIYRVEDIDMNGKIDAKDFKWLEKQNGKVYFSTIP